MTIDVLFGVARRGMKSQTKSKERIRDHGEVFTARGLYGGARSQGDV